MDSGHARHLCLSLMRADTEDGVIGLLQHAGYWDDPTVWRFYGDRETNFNTIFLLSGRLSSSNEPVRPEAIPRGPSTGSRPPDL
jgi:hypothetical protein